MGVADTATGADAQALPRSLAAAELPADPTDLSASGLSAAIRDRQVSCVEVMTAYLARIARLNPVYNAIVSREDDASLIAQAQLADAALARGDYRGWMHGMPHAVKDLANVRGLVTSQGSPLFATTVAAADDLHIARIRSAGAIFVGKTNTPEFGLGSQSYNPVHGTTRCAYDPALTAGGSSGGAACGLALHLLPVADGSDMMGSLRNPGAFNNVIGLRPSQGRVPTVPAEDAFYQQLSTNGPMGRTVEDTARLLLTMAGPDPRAPLARADRLSPPDLSQSAFLEYRVGWLGDYDGYLPTEPGLMPVVEAALAVVAEVGAVVEPCRPAFEPERLWQTWLTLRQWAVTRFQPLYERPELRALLKPELVWEIERGLGLTAAQVAAAGIDRTAWYQALLALFEHHDLLALPTAQVFPFDAQVHWPQAIDGRPMDTYHRWMEVVIGASLAGLPAINLPAGFDARGRPMGLQFIGRPGHDAELLQFALTYEAATDYLQRRPSLA